MFTGGAITSALFGFAIFWMTRYIKGRDDFESATKNSIEKIPEKIKESVTKIEASQKLMQDQVLSLQRSNNDFQSKINKELADIERHAVRTEAIMERTSNKAQELDTKISSMSDRVLFHDKVLKDVLILAKDLRTEAKENKETIQTVITAIGEDKILVGQKTKKS
jgi:hypothetical protein